MVAATMAPSGTMAFGRLNRQIGKNMRNRYRFVVGLTLGLLATSTWAQPGLFSRLPARNIGPAGIGGRIHDVEALPDKPSTIYVAAASGGLWKTTNNGTTWTPIFDDQPVSTFGDLAIAPSHPAILYAGTGEQNNRQSTSWGNGVYRSDDGGKTWRHLGLEETRHIARIVVHPENPDVVYVAALGNLWQESEARGVYRSVDGGRTWEKVLYVDAYTGAVDLVMDPRNPRVLYAALYQRMRKVWGFNGGGPGSGIYKSTDGGDTWQELTNGIPAGDKGRIGLAIARSNPQVLYAVIEHAEEGGVYRSSDGGASWEKVNDLNPRPMYYSHIYVDPNNENRVYLLAVNFYKSEDGGRTFRQMPTRPTYDVGIHSDYHALWIDPNNSAHFLLAGDGGLFETWDMGETYRKINNFVIAQFYAIGVDWREPFYYVYGGTQDNHSWMGPSATRRWIGIINDDWSQVGFGDGMYHAPDPTSPRYLYNAEQNGEAYRVDARTGDMLYIRPIPPEGEPAYRFDWITPIVLSRFDPRTVYLGGNRLFISHDRGETWIRTPDLTRQIDRDTLKLMGVLGKDIRLSRHDGVASFGEITTISESPLSPEILWVGTDDGNVQVSRDGGRTWTEVGHNIPDIHLPGLPYGRYVSRVVASRRGPGSAYVTLDGHREGDFAPYVYRTDDFGQTWEALTDGLPPDGSVHVLIEHPLNPNVLFLGTERALFYSLDAGQHWYRLDNNLPTTIYRDLLIHPRDLDLVIGTHGRGIWIIDDVGFLAEWSPALQEKPAHLFAIRPAHFFHYWKSTSYRSQAAYAGENRPFGALITYYLSRPVDSVQIDIYNAAGQRVRQLSGPGDAGKFLRVVWDLRHEPPPYRETRPQREGLVYSERVWPELPRSVTPVGPFVAPGTYRVVLKAGDYVQERRVQVRPDPEMPIPEAAYRVREAFLLDVLELQRRAFKAEEAVRELEQQLRQREADDVPLDSVRALGRSIRQVRSALYRLAGVFNGRGVRQGSLYPPASMHYAQKERLERRLRTLMQRLNQYRQPQRQ